MSNTIVEPVSAPKKATKWKVIVPVIILVLVCCLFLVMAGIIAYIGTQGQGPAKFLEPIPPPAHPPVPLPPPLSLSASPSMTRMTHPPSPTLAEAGGMMSTYGKASCIQIRNIASRSRRSQTCMLPPWQVSRV